jgi:hypothetical protein
MVQDDAVAGGAGGNGGDRRGHGAGGSSGSSSIACGWQQGWAASRRCGGRGVVSDGRGPSVRRRDLGQTMCDYAAATWAAVPEDTRAAMPSVRPHLRRHTITRPPGKRGAFSSLTGTCILTGSVLLGDLGQDAVGSGYVPELAELRWLCSRAS